MDKRGWWTEETSKQSWNIYACIFLSCFGALLFIVTEISQPQNARDMSWWLYFVSANFSGFVQCANNLEAQIPWNEFRVWLKFFIFFFFWGKSFCSVPCVFLIKSKTTEDCRRTGTCVKKGLVVFLFCIQMCISILNLQGFFKCHTMKTLQVLELLF